MRDSSLSACIQAVVAAEVGHLELAYDYFGEAALMDLGDLEHNTRDGLHMASLAGSWIAAVAGFGGMRDHGGELTLPPAPAGGAGAAALPGALPRAAACGSTSRHAEAHLRAARRGEPMTRPPRRGGVTVRAGEPVDADVDGPDAGPEPRSRRVASPRAGDRLSGLGYRPVVRSIARIDASSGSLASSSWMILWTSCWSWPKSSRIDAQRRVHDLQLRAASGRA